MQHIFGGPFVTWSQAVSFIKGYNKALADLGKNTIDLVHHYDYDHIKGEGFYIFGNVKTKVILEEIEGDL